MDGDWRGKWIGLDWRKDASPCGGVPVAFRKDFLLDGTPSSAVFRVTAHARYVLWINGAFAAAGPARSYPARQAYDEIDATALLRAGANSLAVMVVPPTGVVGYGLHARFGLYLEGEMVLARGRIERVFSDGSWKVATAGWHLDAPLLGSLPTVAQEHVVGSMEPAGWQTEPPGAGWRDAFSLGPALTPPWESLEPRSTPLLTETAAQPPLVWRGRGGAERRPIAENLAALFNRMPLTGASTGDDAPASRGAPVDLSAGEVVTFDLGRTRTVRPRLRVETESAPPPRLECYYDIALGDRPTASLGFGSPGEGFCDTFEPKPGQSAWLSLAARGMRFMTIRAAGTGSCRVWIEPLLVDYPFPDGTSLSCADTLLSAIWSVSAATLRSSAQDVFVDTCWREAMLWTFDAAVMGKAAFLTFGDLALWRRSLSLIGQGIDRDGNPTAVVPAGVTFMKLFDQTMAWVWSCGEYYLHSGDASLLDESADPMLRFLSLCAKGISPEGLFAPPAYAWHWIDWAPLDRRPYSLPVNAMLLLAARRAAGIGEAVRRPDLKEAASAIASRLAPAVRKFWNEGLGCHRSHVEPGVNLGLSEPYGWPGGRPSAWIDHDLHGNAILLATGVIDHERARRTAGFLAGRLSAPLSDANRFGPGWSEFILSPLFEYGHGGVALAFARSVYGQGIAAGAPTWGESFPATRHNSAHGWGASINSVLVERVLGLRPMEPGWRVFEAAPARQAEVGRFAYRLQTPGGPIGLHGDGDRMVLDAPAASRVRLKDGAEVPGAKGIVLK